MPAPSSSVKGANWRKRLDWKVLVISRRALYAWITILFVLLLIGGLLAFFFVQGSTMAEKAKEAISAAEKSILKASGTGAEIFAYEKFAQASQELTKAKRFFDAGDFKTAYDHAVQADMLAHHAQSQSTEESATAARFATVSGVSGKVEFKRAKELSWQPATAGMKLSPEDQIRTFSNSQIQIAFDDASILRVKPNSFIVMGNLSEDINTRTKKSSIRLMVSDVEAKIKGQGTRTSEFRIEMPTAVAKVEKANLAVQVSSENDSRIRVHSGAADISSQDKTVKVTENQEVTITRNSQIISSPSPLAPPPSLVTPIDMRQLVFPNPQQGKVTFVWGKASGAKAYHLQIAQDQFFFDPIVDFKPLESQLYEVERLEAGTYFWRVSSFNSGGSEGGFSDEEIFQLKYTAEGVPFKIDNLVVIAGREGNNVHIQGTTEPSASLSINTVSMQADKEGRFRVSFRKIPSGRFVLNIRIVSQKGGIATFQRDVPVGI